jgi:hypothetical protein
LETRWFDNIDPSSSIPAFIVAQPSSHHAASTKFLPKLRRRKKRIRRRYINKSLRINKNKPRYLGRRFPTSLAKPMRLGASRHPIMPTRHIGKMVVVRRLKTEKTILFRLWLIMYSQFSDGEAYWWPACQSRGTQSCERRYVGQTQAPKKWHERARNRELLKYM